MNDKMLYEPREIRRDALVSNLARLFQILTNTFGLDKAMGALRKIEGKEVTALFPKLGGRAATLKVVDGQLFPHEGPAKNPAATVVFNVEEPDLVPLINSVIRTKANLGGLLKLTWKYLLRGKIKVRGSLGVALKVIKCLMIGEHRMYADEKRVLKGREG
ncbi:MAG: hypothetical protein ACTSU5_20730 [Promethearchaeota archaeon]